MHLRRAQRRTASARARLAVLGLVALMVAAAGGCDASAPSGELGDGSGAPTITRVPQATVPADPTLAAAVGPWRRVPFKADPTYGAPFEAGCRSADPEIGATPRLLVDVRGESRVFLLFASASTAFTCLATTDDPGHPIDVERVTVASSRLADDGIDLASYVVTGTGSGTTAFAVGRVGSAPTEVIASFVDETFVFATRGGGWWAMWWPLTVACQGISAVDQSHLVLSTTPAPCQPGASPLPSR